MPVITFHYLENPQLDPRTGKPTKSVFVPYVPIRICYKHQFLPNFINSLVDSGSQINLFPAYFAEKLKIKIKKGKNMNIFGIGNVLLEGYGHDIQIILGNSYSFLSRIYFSYKQEIPILGRGGFFDKFEKVVFKEKRKILNLYY